jgi:hypothetical protein
MPLINQKPVLQHAQSHVRVIGALEFDVNEYPVTGLAEKVGADC